MLIPSIFQGKSLLVNHRIFPLRSCVLRICKGPLFHTIGRPEDFFFPQDCISFQWEAGTGSSLALQEFSLACSSHRRTDTECLLCARSSARLFKWGRYTCCQNLCCCQGTAAIEGSSGPFPKQARVTYSYDASSKSILIYQSTACSLIQLLESLSSGEPEGLILSTHAFYLT